MPPVGAGLVVMAALVSTLALPQEKAPVAPFLAPVRAVPSGDDPIGLRRSGAICAPAGKLLWRDLGADGSTLAAHASLALRDAGTPVAVQDAEALAPSDPPAAPQIVATIERVTMRSCTPWHGLKLAAAVRASGRLIVTWRLYGVGGGSPLAKVTSCRSFRVDDTPTLHAVFDRAFVESAVAVVPAIVAAKGAVPTLPQDAICASEELPTR